VSTGTIVGAIVGIVAAVVVVTVVVIHESSKKRTLTGCVSSGENGISAREEKDKRIYVLSGNTVGIRTGDRITLSGKKVNPKGAGTLILGSKTGSQELRPLSALASCSKGVESPMEASSGRPAAEAPPTARSAFSPSLTLLAKRLRKGRSLANK
jgi:hypothetical protein